MHAVEVGHDGSDVHGVGILSEEGCDRLSEGQLLLGVDLDRGGLGDVDEADPAEEAVARAAEARGIHDVEGTGLEVVGLTVLASGACARIVVHPRRDTGLRGPQEPVGLDRGEDAVVLVGPDQVDGDVDVARIDERRRGLQEDQDLGFDTAFFEHVQGMQQHAFARRLVAGEGRRPFDDLRSPLLRDRGDLLVVRRDDHTVDGCRGPGCCDRAGHQGHAADASHVLARDAFRAAARGDDRDDFRRHLPTFARTASTDERALRRVLPVPRSTSGSVVVVDDGSVRISRRSVAPARTSSAGKGRPRHDDAGQRGDRRELGGRLAAMRKVGDRSDGCFGCHPVEVRRHRHPAVDGSCAAQQHPSGRGRRERPGRASRPVELMLLDAYAELTEGRRAGCAERERREELDLPGARATEDLLERERRHPRGQSALLHSRTREGTAAGERVGERERVGPVVEERDAPGTQNRRGEPELSREPVADEPVPVLREQLPRDAEIGLAFAEQCAAIDELVGRLGHLRCEPARQRHRGGDARRPIPRRRRAEAVTPPTRSRALRSNPWHIPFRGSLGWKFQGDGRV